jgi:mannose-6-phosphate isomerase-like protein (cupin superfamily)
VLAFLTNDGNTQISWVARSFKEVEMTHVDIGNYEVVSHLETPECSLRLLKLAKDKFVHLHHHHKTTQIYFVLEGIAQAMVDEETVVLEPHQILRIPADTLHGIRTGGEALVLSISIPPLETPDQHVAAEHR